MSLEILLVQKSDVSQHDHTPALQLSHRSELCHHHGCALAVAKQRHSTTNGDSSSMEAEGQLATTLLVSYFEMT